MWRRCHQLLSPPTAYRYAQQSRLWFAGVSTLCFIFGLIGALFLAPADYQQGNVFRIIYIHVPAAMWSLGVYAIMTIASFIFLIWKIKLADMVAAASAPLGALFTGLALVTGSLWGKPTWGTFWIWDARLTSELILLFIYFGIMALRSAMPDRQMGGKASSLMTLVGVINLPIIHYSVDWWQTLHQGATLLKWGAPTMPWSMLWPLLTMVVAWGGYYAWMLTLLLQYELLQRERKSNWGL